MKVNFDLNKASKHNYNVAFGDYKPVKSSNGFKEYEFFYPYDEKSEDLYIEFYIIDKDRQNNYKTIEPAISRNGKKRIQLTKNSHKIDISDQFGIEDNTPFGYRYVIVKRNPGNGEQKENYRIDAGDSIVENGSAYNIVIPTKSNLTRGGDMKLVIIDSHNVGYVYNDQNLIVKDENIIKKAKSGIKNLVNKNGGTLAGLEKAVDDGEFDNYERIISLPIFTDDDFTPHAYWNKNCFQMASSLGNINNYASLQRKMFAHGLNFVSDGAFVNEGLQGVHFNHLLKWGERSPYLYWFNTSTIKDGVLSLGVLGKDSRFTTHKLVNAPITYSQDINGIIHAKRNPLYDKTKPTFINLLDRRLTTEEERKNPQILVNNYSKMNTDNIYDIHTHNDSVFPYAFEIHDFDCYKKNIENLNRYNTATNKKIRIDGAEGTRLLSKFPNFEFENKFESGFETWDANPDIGKLRFTYSGSDVKSLMNLSPIERKKEEDRILRGNAQVQDYTVETGRYWTRKTDDILRLHIAQNLKNLPIDNPGEIYNLIELKTKTIKDKDSNGNLKIKKNVFPKDLMKKISRQEVENVVNDLYMGKRKLETGNKQEQILKEIMNMPLDSIEFGDNLVGVLASPLISKRANTKEEIGVSRYDLYKQGNKNLPDEYAKTYLQMESIYKNELYNYVLDILDVIDTQQPENTKLFDGQEVSEYGKYVLPLIVPKITKYAIVRALDKNLSVGINDQTGEFNYDYKKMKQIHLQSLRLPKPSSPQDEAEMVLDKIKKGLETNLDSSINSEIMDGIRRMLKGTSLESFRLADLIIDKTQSGLDWRIDATKDIANVEGLRNQHDNFDETWNTVIGFWNKFVQTVLKENPNAYMVAEVTDENDLYNRGWGGEFFQHRKPSEKYKSQEDIIPKFERETGMTTIANYSYFFTDVAKIFAKGFESGDMISMNNIQTLLYEKMLGKEDYIKKNSLDSLKYSYTFISNHDKPRPLHYAALDMNMFYTDLLNPNNEHYRKMAFKMVEDKFGPEDISPEEIGKYDFSGVSPKAVAMGYAIRKPAVELLNKYRKEFKTQEQFDNAYRALSKTISELSAGKYQDKYFDPDAFGVTPIDANIKEIIKIAKERKDYKLELPEKIDKSFEKELFVAVIGPAFSRLLGMMKYLVALPGMPTLFDGDDKGSTGGETKTKNIYGKDRQRNHDEWFEGDEISNPEYIKMLNTYKSYLDDVMKIRKKPECDALNNGGVFVLPIQTIKSPDDNKEYLVPAILRQNTDGKMAISIFNTSGYDYNPENYYTPKHLKTNSIVLNVGPVKKHDKDRGDYYDTDDRNKVFMDGAYGIGLTGITPGTKFHDANNPKIVFVVRKSNGAYYLEREDKNMIEINDSTLILYHDPETDSPKD